MVDSLFVSVGWAAFMALLGGAISVAICLRLPQTFRAAVFAVSILGALAVSYFVSPIYVADKLGLDGVRNWLMSEKLDALEDQVSALPEHQRQTLATIREMNPSLYMDVMGASITLSERGVSQDEVFAAVDQMLDQELTSRLPLLSDDELSHFMLLSIEQTGLLIGEHEEACLLILSSEPLRLELAVNFPPRSFEIDAEIMRIALGSELPGGEALSEEEAQALSVAAAELLVQSYGDSVNQLFLAYQDPTHGFPAGACEMTTEYMSNLHTVAGAQVGPLWRSLNLP